MGDFDNTSSTPSTTKKAFINSRVSGLMGMSIGFDKLTNLDAQRTAAEAYIERQQLAGNPTTKSVDDLVIHRILKLFIAESHKVREDDGVSQPALYVMDPRTHVAKEATVDAVDSDYE